MANSFSPDPYGLHLLLPPHLSEEVAMVMVVVSTLGFEWGKKRKMKGRSDIHSLHPTPNPWHYGVKERSSTRCARPCDGAPRGAPQALCAQRSTSRSGARDRRHHPYPV